MTPYLLGFGLLILALVAMLGLSPVFTQAGNNARAALFTFGGSTDPIVVAATATNASPTLTATGSLIGVRIGAVVTGTGIPAATTVLALDDAANTVTLSANATATNTGNYTFTPPAEVLVTNGGFFHLVKTDFTPGLTTDRASLIAIEADFDGYASKTLTMTTGYIDASGNAYAQSQLLSWIKSAGVNTNTVYGWWIDDGTNVLMSAKFSEPVALDATGKELSGVMQDGYPIGPSWQPLIPSGV